MIINIACVIGGYLLGAIPFGLIVAKRLRGIDIREYGSGNIGATNVYRILGPIPGIIVLIFDILKGAVPAWVAYKISNNPELWSVLAGVSAVAGHSLSPFLRFSGGKSVATGLGLLLGVAPVTAGISVIVFIFVLLLARWVSLASIIASITAGVSMYFFRVPLPAMIVITLAIVLIIVRHKANILRLIRGTEPKFSFGKPKENEESHANTA